MGKAIGIIGGVGPLAGADLLQKIISNTDARIDQDHIDTYLTSCPSLIPDRTGFLFHQGINPAEGIFTCIEKLVSIGAEILAIPCNTAHARPIFNVVEQKVQQRYDNVLLLNMIKETCNEIIRSYPKGVRIGLLATQGTYRTNIYQSYLREFRDIRLLLPDEEGKKLVHQAIYDQSYGIKAVNPISTTAKDMLLKQADILISQGAAAIILGCTEIPLVLKPGTISCKIIDPTVVLARAAIREAFPEKLKLLND